METDSFNVFIDVYRLQSFAEVAKRRNVAPSSITRVIAQLEEELGMRLFNRTTRKVSATEDGEVFFKKILPIAEELENITEKYTDKDTSGILRITTNASFNYYFLNDIIIKFKKRYPQIKLEILVSDQNVDLVTERIDAAIRFGKLNDSSFIGYKLFDLDYRLCASPKYLQGKNILLPSELTNQKVLGFLIPRYNLTWKFKKKTKVYEVNIAPDIKVTGALSLIEYTRAGLGLSMVPYRFVEKDISKGLLVTVLDSYVMTPTEFDSAAWLLYPSKNFIPKKLSLFLDFIKELYK